MAGDTSSRLTSVRSSLAKENTRRSWRSYTSEAWGAVSMVISRETVFNPLAKLCSDPRQNIRPAVNRDHEKQVANRFARVIRLTYFDIASEGPYFRLGTRVALHSRDFYFSRFAFCGT